MRGRFIFAAFIAALMILNFIGSHEFTHIEIYKKYGIDSEFTTCERNLTILDVTFQTMNPCARANSTHITKLRNNQPEGYWNLKLAQSNVEAFGYQIFALIIIILVIFVIWFMERGRK